MRFSAQVAAQFLDRNGDLLMLWAAAEITGYQDGRWATFKQWQQIGAQVRRGEKGTPIVFYREGAAPR